MVQAAFFVNGLFDNFVKKSFLFGDWKNE
jgi:hypothetical protein